MSDTYSARLASRNPGSLFFSHAVMDFEMVISLAMITKRVSLPSVCDFPCGSFSV
jgi:hypothetical protein